MPLICVVEVVSGRLMTTFCPSSDGGVGGMAARRVSAANPWINSAAWIGVRGFSVAGF